MKKYLDPYYFFLLTKTVQTKIWSVFNRISAKLWRVNIGRNCGFYKQTYFRKVPDSLINIGSGCYFDSNRKSNRVGNNTSCIISTLKKGAQISIGNDCGFSGTVISAGKSIHIANNVRCGANTLITDTDWHTDDFRTSPDAEVTIEEGVWLGYGVKILKGVTIGRNSLIGACSVVTKSIPPNVIAAGNPCRVVKKIDD